MITLKLEVNELNIIMSALGQMPYVNVADIITKIRQEVAPQLQQTNIETEKE